MSDSAGRTCTRALQAAGVVLKRKILYFPVASCSSSGFRAIGAIVKNKGRQ